VSLGTASESSLRCLDRIGQSRRLAFEERENSGKSGTRGGGAGFDGFVDAVKVAPGQSFDSGTKDKVGVPFPAFELMLLRGTDRAAHDLEGVCWRAATAVLQAHGNTDDDFGA